MAIKIVLVILAIAALCLLKYFLIKRIEIYPEIIYPTYCSDLFRLANYARTKI